MKGPFCAPFRGFPKFYHSQNSLIALSDLIFSSLHTMSVNTSSYSLSCSMIKLGLSSEPKQAHSEHICSLDLVCHCFQLIHVPMRPNEFSVQELRLWTHGPYNELCRKLNWPHISITIIMVRMKYLLSSSGNSGPCSLAFKPISVSNTPGCTLRTK